MKQLIITNKPTKKDYLQIKKLYLSYFEETLTNPEYKANKCAFKTVRKLKKVIRLPYYEFVMVKDPETDEIVAFAKAKVCENGIGLFCHIYVTPAYRLRKFRIGQEEVSIAEYLNSSIENWLLLSGCHTIEIETFKDDLRLHNFLTRKRAYQVAREYPDAYILQKRLKNNERYIASK